MFVSLISTFPRILSLLNITSLAVHSNLCFEQFATANILQLTFGRHVSLQIHRVFKHTLWVSLNYPLTN